MVAQSNDDFKKRADILADFAEKVSDLQSSLTTYNAVQPHHATSVEQAAYREVLSARQALASALLVAIWWHIDTTQAVVLLSATSDVQRRSSAPGSQVSK